ncbi:MAG: histidine phosphatase family protein [Flavobacteriales bacterium]|jgi:phosphohistidine phosphatase|nr:histidine phosphatase family protein [Flavobacteriales bacterium]
MKTLYIVRHAKSSWEYEGIEDIDRPLKKSGINAAYFISQLLQEKIERPDIFMSSSANRALHTAVIFTGVFKFPFANLKINKSLYSFKDGYLTKTIKALDDGYTSAIIFSHNHGINDFVNQFGDEYIENVPTCGVVGIQFNEEHWKDIKKGKTILKEFPKFYSI